MVKSAVIAEEFEAIRTALEALEPLDPTQRRFAISMILTRLGMSDFNGVPSSGAGGHGAGTLPAGGSSLNADGIKGMTAKEFVRRKNPSTDLERFTCLAYYLMHANGIAAFSTRDITKLNGEAHGTEFSNAAATAMNGVNQSRFFSKAGAGKKRITTLGEAVVEALPDRDKVKETLAAAPRRSKGKGKKRQGKG